MQYNTIYHTEIDGPADPGWYVVAFTDDGGDGRVVSGPFPDEPTAQARADLFSTGQRKRIEDYVAELIGCGINYTQADVREILRRTDLTQFEREAVMTQVQQALEFEASFDHRQVTGLLESDMGGAAA